VLGLGLVSAKRSAAYCTLVMD